MTQKNRETAQEISALAAADYYAASMLNLGNEVTTYTLEGDRIVRPAAWPTKHPGSWPMFNREDVLHVLSKGGGKTLDVLPRELKPLTETWVQVLGGEKSIPVLRAAQRAVLSQLTPQQFQERHQSRCLSTAAVQLDDSLAYKALHALVQHYLAQQGN